MIKLNKLYVFLVCLVVLITAAYAQDVRLNISFSEKIYENVSYAENFYLEEKQKFVLIEGLINVSNPSSETVHDIYLTLVNTKTLDGNMKNQGGRNATQFGYIGNFTEYDVTIGNTTNNLTLRQDFDNDNINDSVWVNNTHIIINLTAAGIVPIRVTDYFGANSNLTVQAGKSIKTESEISAGGVFYGRLVVNGTYTGSEINNTLNASWVVKFRKSTNNVTIFIPELRSGQSALMNYTVFSQQGDGVLVQNPLDLNTEYLNAYSTKVLAGHEFVVRDTVTNRPAQAGLNYTILIINISMYLVSVPWNNTSYNFTFLNISNTGDYYNVFAYNKTGGDLRNVSDNLDTRENRTWYWVPNNGTLMLYETANITYTILAPYNVPTSNTYQFMKQDIFFLIYNVVSNLTLVDVTGAAELRFNLSKQIWNESNNLSNHNVTWRIDANVGVPINVTYNVSKVTLWVTYNLNPNNATPLSINYSPSALLNQTTSWSVSPSWYFEYTDGSSLSYPPPIIWMKPYYIIYNGFNQIVNQSVTQVGKDLYLKYIYVVNGYWLSVDKRIINTAENTYNITVEVLNVGNGFTPSGYVVQVYDFVPSGFLPSGFNPGFNANMTTNQPGYNGTAYQWVIPLGRTNNMGCEPGLYYNASFAPRNHCSGRDRWNTTYMVQGSGDYRVSDLYIVGLDPMRVDGAGTSPLIAIKEGLQNRSYEIIFALVVIVLLIVNVANLVMSQRIELKLEKVKHHERKYDDLKEEIERIKQKLK